MHEIHDPGLTPGGHSAARLFVKNYPHLRDPRIILTSHLRRTLQMAVEIQSCLEERCPDLGRIPIFAHPDLQEVSNHPCDTGTPLDVLRQEFPHVEFPDTVFPDEYPRAAHIKPVKYNTVFDDDPHLLAARARRIREYLKYQLDETEIILVSHGSFVHLLLNRWAGRPGASRTHSPQFQVGEAKPYTIPGKTLRGLQFEKLVDYDGPFYPSEYSTQDSSAEVELYGVRDCGIFTHDSVRHAPVIEKYIPPHDPDWW